MRNLIIQGKPFYIFFCISVQYENKLANTYQNFFYVWHVNMHRQWNEEIMKKHLIKTAKTEEHGRARKEIGSTVSTGTKGKKPAAREKGSGLLSVVTVANCLWKKHP